MPAPSHHAADRCPSPLLPLLPSSPPCHLPIPLFSNTCDLFFLFPTLSSSYPYLPLPYHLFHLLIPASLHSLPSQSLFLNSSLQFLIPAPSSPPCQLLIPGSQYPEQSLLSYPLSASSLSPPPGFWLPAPASSPFCPTSWQRSRPLGEWD